MKNNIDVLLIELFQEASFEYLLFFIMTHIEIYQRNIDHILFLKCKIHSN